MTQNTPRKVKKSETIELRIGWDEKQAFKHVCEQDGVAASERLRTLIQAHLSEQAEQSSPLSERISQMSQILTQRPRTFIAAITSTAAALAIAAAAPSMAGIDTQAAFARMDTDRNGQISFDEFYAQIAEDGLFLGPDAPIDAPERLASESEILGSLHREYALYDRNRDGAIEHREFAGHYVWRMETTFRALDRNDDGHIQVRELARVMGAVGLNEDNASLNRLERANAAIAALDSNGDGALDFDEYSDVS